MYSLVLVRSLSSMVEARALPMNAAMASISSCSSVIVSIWKVMRRARFAASDACASRRAVRRSVKSWMVMVVARVIPPPRMMPPAEDCQNGATAVAAAARTWKDTAEA